MDMQTNVCEVRKALSRPKNHQFFQLRFYLPKFLERTPWLTLIRSQSPPLKELQVQYVRVV